MIQHLSYSSVRQFLTSPAKFKKVYIDKVVDEVPLPFLIGKSWHVGLEEFYKDNEEFIYEAIRYFDEHKGIQEYDQEKLEQERDRLEVNLMRYRDHRNNGDIPWIASKSTEFIESKAMISISDELLPLKGVIDHFTEDFNPVDHKYVTRFTADSDIEKYYVQAWFYYMLSPVITGNIPTVFIISEWKKTENRDGSPQYRHHVIRYEKEWIDRISHWYVGICKLIQTYEQLDQFPANPFQPFGASDWTEYLKGSESNPIRAIIDPEQIGEMEDS